MSAAGNLTLGVWRDGVLVADFQRPFHRVGNSQKMGGCCVGLWLRHCGAVAVLLWLSCCGCPVVAVLLWLWLWFWLPRFMLASESECVSFTAVAPLCRCWTAGWAFPVATGTGDTYRLSLPGGAALPLDWVIEFSDPVFGNRWTADQQSLLVEGRSCPAVTTSQHDRRWVYADPSAWLPAVGWGRGACSGEADMPPIGCASVAPLRCPPATGPARGAAGTMGAARCLPAAGWGLLLLALLQCSLAGVCTATTLCLACWQCGTGRCECKAGFSGPLCEEDVCASARCGDHGRCASTYLGAVPSLPLPCCPTHAVRCARCVPVELISGAFLCRCPPSPPHSPWNNTFGRVQVAACRLWLACASASHPGRGLFAT